MHQGVQEIGAFASLQMQQRLLIHLWMLRSWGFVLHCCMWPACCDLSHHNKIKQQSSCFSSHLYLTHKSSASFESALYSDLGENEQMGPSRRSSRMWDVVTKFFVFSPLQRLKAMCVRCFCSMAQIQQYQESWQLSQPQEMNVRNSTDELPKELCISLFCLENLIPKITWSSTSKDLLLTDAQRKSVQQWLVHLRCLNCNQLFKKVDLLDKKAPLKALCDWFYRGSNCVHYSLFV